MAGILRRLQVEWAFFRGLVAMNLASAMEYRAAFLSQIAGMFLNNGIYFIFWLLFFDKFGAVQGYGSRDVFLLFAIVALGHGLGFMMAANVGPNLAELIAQGRLDYYLVMPRPLLLHVVFSRIRVDAIGDLVFGLAAYLFTGRFQAVEIALFLASSFFAGAVLVGFGVITGSLAFFLGHARLLSMQAGNAIVTFALYPNSLFSGLTGLLLYTLLPAAFVGAVPVEIVRGQDGRLLLALGGVAGLVWLLGGAVFYLGVRRYESGSAINVNL